MTAAEAAKLLEVSPDATPEQLEARFLELRTRLEDKIAKAPTPGLKAKYRESLEQITVAFETLTLAADSSALPVLNKSVAGVADPGHKRQAPAPGSPPPATVPSGKKRKNSFEFLLVAAIAVVVLGAGAWWVMKTRAENAEKSRLAAEAKAEADRLAEEKRLAAEAEQRRIAEEKRRADEEKEKAAAAAKLEQERQDKLSGQLRARIAAAKVEWEALEREERSAERQLTELKSDLRSLRDASTGKLAQAQALVSAQQAYYGWLSDTLARHPARVARSRAEELLSARQPAEAAVAVAEFESGLRQLTTEVPRQREMMLDQDGELAIQTGPDVSWTLTDAFGVTRQGKGPKRLDNVAVGSVEVEFSLPLWPSRREQASVTRSKPASVTAEFVPHHLTLESTPAGASVFLADGTKLGVTPLQLPHLPPGKITLTLRHPGHYDRTVAFALDEGKSTTENVSLKARPTSVTWPESATLPARFSVESRSQSSHNSYRSTGLYAKSPTDSRFQSSSVEEWSFSEPDASGAWQRAERHFVRSEPAAATLATAGSVVVYHRKADGKWQGEFREGGVTNDAYRAVIQEQFDPTAAPEWLKTCWPPAGTPVGGTWSVPLKPFSIAGYMGGTVSSQATGKLVAFNREATRDWVELEFTYRATETAKTQSSDHSGTWRVRFDLEGYVMSLEITTQGTSTTKAGIAGTLVMDSSSHTTSTYTKR